MATIGVSSVRYEIGLFRETERDVQGEFAAEGWFVHVFVDRASQRPVAIPESIRGALELLAVGGGEAG